MGHPVEVLTVQVVTPRAVANHGTGECGGTEVTDVLTTRRTELTLATARNEGDGDVIAGLEPRDVGTDRLDNARALVTANDREHRVATREELENLGVLRNIPRAEVLIRVAHTRKGHLDLDFARCRFVDINRFSRPRRIERHQHGSLHLHVIPLSSKLVDPTLVRKRQRGTASRSL